MSDPTSLFSQQGSGDTPPANQQGTDAQLATLLADIKNADGQPKYKDVNTAIAALKASQEFIPTLQSQLEAEKARNAELATTAARAAELERLVESLTKPNSQSTPSSTPEVKPVDIRAEVQAVLASQQQAEVAKKNTDSVVAKVAEKFGADAEKTFYEKAKAVGLSVTEINALAAKSPQAVFTLLGITESAQRPPNTAPSGSSINTGGFAPSAESMIGKNKSPVLVGATTQQVIDEVRRAKSMVAELDANGMSINDLTNPKVFFKHFV